MGTDSCAGSFPRSSELWNRFFSMRTAEGSNAVLGFPEAGKLLLAIEGRSEIRGGCEVHKTADLFYLCQLTEGQALRLLALSLENPDEPEALLFGWEEKLLLSREKRSEETLPDRTLIQWRGMEGWVKWYAEGGSLYRCIGEDGWTGIEARGLVFAERAFLCTREPVQSLLVVELQEGLVSEIREGGCRDMPAQVYRSVIPEGWGEESEETEGKVEKEKEDDRKSSVYSRILRFFRRMIRYTGGNRKNRL